MRIRVDLAYDGGPFHGFARQPQLRTVQGTLEDRLSRLLGQDVDTIGAGRTDRGVHASGQVVHVDVDEGVAAATRALADRPGLRGRLDRMVGEAITIWRVRSVDPAYHARFSATERRYRYRLADAPALHPLRRFNVWHLGEALSVDRMQAAARHLVGEHDFASLCRAAEGRRTVRRVDHIAIARADGLVHVAVRGPAFCHQQIRSMVGVLVEVGRGRRDPDWASDVLAARDRSAAPRVAPPHGLTLEVVSYGRRWPAAPPSDVLDLV
ncbi:MAG: tRNA pseudouridine(38-40) synthase TruA [Actinomycetota bacterium]|nr:tRNA pseudouridine(38-40) synthase TruA [Actinomycetota bacterium]